MNAIYFHHMLYTCIMDKRNHFYLVLLQENNPFFYCLDGFLFHLQASQTLPTVPTGGSKDVGKEYTNAIHFHPMFHRMYYGQEEPLLSGIS